MESFEIKMAPELQALFKTAEILEPVEGSVSSNVDYIVMLERGTSEQAPNGFIRANLSIYEDILNGEIRHALDQNPEDIQRALRAGISSATVLIAGAIADKTPVDTSRAKNAWTANLPSGRKIPMGPEITPQQQSAIRKARRRSRQR